MVTSREVADALALEHVGPPVDLLGASSLADALSGSLLFVTDEVARTFEWGGRSDVAMIARRPIWPYTTTTLISENPRRDFGRAVRQFFAGNDPPFIHPTVVMCTARVIVGARARIGPYTCVGTLGFGIEEGERLPHMGGVRIGDDVEIGALCAIARGTLGDTVIGDRARIDDHVFIAHNVQVGNDVLIIAGAEISGSVVIGDRAKISPQACVSDHVMIGADAHVGIGAVVLHDVEPGAVVVGNPARRIR